MEVISRFNTTLTLNNCHTCFAVKYAFNMTFRNLYLTSLFSLNLLIFLAERTDNLYAIQQGSVPATFGIEFNL